MSRSDMNEALQEGFDFPAMVSGRKQAKLLLKPTAGIFLDGDQIMLKSDGLRIRI